MVRAFTPVFVLSPVWVERAPTASAAGGKIPFVLIRASTTAKQYWNLSCFSCSMKKLDDCVIFFFIQWNRLLLP